MARRTPRPEATHQRTLIPLKERCEQCGQPLSVSNHGHRSVATDIVNLLVETRLIVEIKRGERLKAVKYWGELTVMR